MNAYGGFLEYAFRYHVNTTMPMEDLHKSYLANYDVVIEVLPNFQSMTLKDKNIKVFLWL